MNQVMEKVVEEINKKLKCLQINFDDTSWRKDIPSEAGWYMIMTKTPIEALRSVGSPSHIAHINIPETITGTSEVRDAGIAIHQQLRDEDYIVYNGEAKNLRARAREHGNGHAKTYCLGLSNYKSLRSYRWTFCYMTASSCMVLTNKEKNDKLLRLAVEQGWRAYNGWPILCKK